jgi:predicted GNAT family acetyltransferase
MLVGTLDESLSGSDTTDEDDEDIRKESTLTALLKKQAILADRGSGSNGAVYDSDDDSSARKHRGSGKPPLLWFWSPVLPANSYFGIYRAIFTPEELAAESEIPNVIKRKQSAPITMPKPGPDGKLAPAVYKGPHIFLCMIGGGHFAAMVVSLAPRQTKHGNTGPMNREATVLAHKTFHRYTTRRKQGGSQSANDNAKGNAHSAGSSIRRYNEQALTDEIRVLLGEWKGLLDSAELLFIRATGSANRRTLFGPYEGQVLKANDARIRGFPFSTRRATQNELMRSFIELTRLKVREIDPKEKVTPQEVPSQSSTPKPAKQAVPKLTEEEEMALLHTSQLQAFVRRSKLPGLLAYLKNNELPADFSFQPADSQQNHHAPTPLHFSASQNSATLVSGLLLKAGADPTTKNKEGKTAFELAGDRATRDAFRVARDELGEDKWDWEAAKVPPPLKRADAEKRDEREKKEDEVKEVERRKAEEARLNAERPVVADSKSRGKGIAASMQKTAQEKREEEARGLTPEQRMKLDRERRARAAEERIRRLQSGG